MLEAPLSPQTGHADVARAAAAARWARPPAVAAPPAVEATPVAEIMAADVVAFAADDSLEHATRTMLERGISGAPVLGADGRPVGMLSKTDLIEAWVAHRRAAAAASPPPVALHRGGISMPLGSGFHLDTPSQVAVGDIMVPYLLAVPADAPISLAIALMAYEGVHRLLVLGEDNQMVGIVTTLDVLRYIAQLSGFCLPAHGPAQPGARDG